MTNFAKTILGVILAIILILIIGQTNKNNYNNCIKKQYNKCLNTDNPNCELTSKEYCDFYVKGD